MEIKRILSKMNVHIACLKRIFKLRRENLDYEMKSAIQDTIGSIGIESFALQEVSIGRLPEINR